MSDYRRYFVPGGSYFFTLVTYRRQPIFRHGSARRLFRECLARERGKRPFAIDGIVLLPDHMHMIWLLPAGDAKYPLRWSSIKGDFTRRWLRLGGSERRVTVAQQRERRRGLWQRRFYEHTLRDEEDFVAHLDYIHYNPVRHGLAASPAAWQWSSFHRYVKQHAYPIDWGRGEITFPTIDDTLVE